MSRNKDDQPTQNLRGTPKPPPLPADVPRERYSSTGEIAAGGMARIHRVVDHQLHRLSAMKILDEAYAANPRERQRFIEEAQITGQLDHPNIVPVHELQVDGEGPRFVMKLVDGVTLSAEVRRARQDAKGLEWLERFLEIFVKICDGVAFAHSRGVIHRDLKPANILVGNYGEVYVMDWGLAKVIHRQGVDVPRTYGGDLDPEGVAIGTVQYMSPEQARGENQLTDERTDVFLLGAVLYFILTARAPYGHLEGVEALVAAQEARITPPQAVVGDEVRLPPEICQIAMKAMARDPGDRFSSVTQLRTAVHRFLRGGNHLEQRTIPARTVVIREGDPGREAFMIVRGSCQAYKTVDGAKVVLRRMGPGDVFGEMAILSAKPRSASVEALEELTVMVVTAQTLSDELGMSSWIGAFVKALADRFREADERLTALESAMLEDGGD